MSLQSASLNISGICRVCFSANRQDMSENKRSVCKLRAAAEHCKHILSTVSPAQSFVESLYEGIDYNCQITRWDCRVNVWYFLSEWKYPQAKRTSKQTIVKLLLWRSRKTMWSVIMTFRSFWLFVPRSRARFDGLCSSLIQKCLQPIGKLLAAGNLEKSDIDKVKKQIGIE